MSQSMPKCCHSVSSPCSLLHFTFTHFFLSPSPVGFAQSHSHTLSCCKLNQFAVKNTEQSMNKTVAKSQ